MLMPRANGMPSLPTVRLGASFGGATRLVGLFAIAMLWALPATARPKPVVFVGLVTPPQVDAETGLRVGDASRLHDVLDKLRNNPAALGLTSSSATIQLAENAIYRLDPNQVDMGRVQLAARTDLVGGNQYTDDRDEYGNPGADGIPDALGVDALGNQIFASRQTIIDGRGLSGNRAVVEAGLENVIRNLTVWSARDPVPGGSNTPGAEIRLELINQHNVGRLEVDRVICEKGRRGVSVNTANGSQNYLTVRRSILRDHADPVDFAWGLQVAAGGVSGVQSSATLRHNRIYNNRIGVFLVTGGTDVEITLNSHYNVIEANGTGIVTVPRDGGFPQGLLQNRIQVHSIRDMIWNNGVGGGVFVRAYQRDLSGAEIRDIETALLFLGTRFVKLTTSGAFDGLQNRQGNTRRDLRIVAASGLAGPTSDISVRLLQLLTTSSLMPTTYDPAPAPIFIDDNAPEVVDITIIGCPTIYERTNEGVNVPDASLFSSHCHND